MMSQNQEKIIVLVEKFLFGFPTNTVIILYTIFFKKSIIFHSFYNDFLAKYHQ